MIQRAVAALEEIIKAGPERAQSSINRAS